MEVIRYINDVKISGEMPVATIENSGVLRVVRDLQLRVLQENSGKISGQTP